MNGDGQEPEGSGGYKFVKLFVRVRVRIREIEIERGRQVKKVAKKREVR